MKKAKITLDLGTLRRHAEERVHERERQGTPRASGDLQRLVHELEVHQVELEMQNEELRESRLDLEASLARYTEIFDFAPMGYVTISLDGTLHEVNHAAAKLIGSARSHLLARPFDSFIVPSDRATFLELVRRVVDSESRQSCNVQLFRIGGHVVEVQLLASLLASSEPLIVLALDDRSTQSFRSEPASAASGVVVAARPADAAGRR